MTNKKSLSDEELKNVSGGGEGNVPAGGITFSNYRGSMAHNYYSKEPNLNPGNVVYTYLDTDLGANGYCLYRYEDITVIGSRWVAINQGGIEICGDDFAAKFPYILNIHPESDNDPEKG